MKVNDLRGVFLLLATLLTPSRAGDLISSVPHGEATLCLLCAEMERGNTEKNSEGLMSKMNVNVVIDSPKKIAGAGLYGKTLV